MSEHKVVVSTHEAGSGSVRSYTVGFTLSVILTLAAYMLTVNDVLNGWTLVYTLAGLAIVQLAVQLLFFLHLGRESRPRWNLTVMSFALMVVIILVFGSLWIMKNIQYNHSHGESPSQTDNFIKHDEGY